MQEELMTWDPNKNKNATLDAYKTLFVGRLSFDTGSDKLRREFEQYGRIAEVSVVKDKVTGKSKGYAFIEFDSEKDMRHAYKYSDGMKIDNRRILVDVERGRTVQGWRPRRFGGGLGDSRKTKDKKKTVKRTPTEKISLHDGPQYHNAVFEQMRRDPREREKKHNYGGFGLDRNARDKGTGKYNPGYEIWDQGRRDQRRNFGTDFDSRRDGRGRDDRSDQRGAGQRRDYDNGNGDVRDDEVLKKKIKRERSDKYEGYGDGRKNDWQDNRRQNFVKREFRERPSNDNDTHRQRGYNSEKRKKYYRD